MTAFFWFLFFLFLCVIALDFLFGRLSFGKHTLSGRMLGRTCFGAAFVTSCYLISVFIEDYFLYSVFSSLYFIGIDVTLLECVAFVRIFTQGKEEQPPLMRGWQVIYLWALVDSVLLAINPFVEVSIRYVNREHRWNFLYYSYEMLFPYRMHLTLAYVLIALIVIILFRRLLQVPSVYRRQYLYAILSLLLVVGINALYLYLPILEGVQILDYSLFGYSLTAFFFYWICFVYVPHGMMDQMRLILFERIGQSIFLFDYTGRLLMENEAARKTFDGTGWGEKEKTVQNLLAFLDVDELSSAFRANGGASHISFQFYPQENCPLRSMRCDFDALYSTAREKIGFLFVFADLLPEYDSLTGFYSWDEYKKKDGQRVIAPDQRLVAAACDINDLAGINHMKGRNVGDQAILLVARLMRKHFPAGTLLIRSREAILVAVSDALSEQEVLSRLEEIDGALKNEPLDGITIGLQSAAKVGESPMRVEETVRGAMDTLRIQKLLNQNSRHSEVLYSLIQALQECDPDTEAHVRRTQKLGARLGKRIGLTEEEQGKLSLLAILHDIGKIGIPLDILNKPGKLSEAEWSVLRTHVEKGYQIAMSTEAFREIADMILYHHERWDGKGYPSGLSKESIPLLSRVISVVDAYDAMVNDRPYRPGMSAEKACRELKKCAGTQFDPTLVSAFLQLLKEDGVEMAGEADAAAADDAADVAHTNQQWSTPHEEETPRVHAMHYSRYLLDYRARILQVDDIFEKMTGYTAGDVRERQMTQWDLIFEEDLDEYKNILRGELQRGTRAYLEHRIRMKNGSPLFVYCFGRSYYDSANREERTEIIISDSASSYSVQSVVQIERGKAFRRLERWENKFRRDSLTGLLNHEAFKNDVETRLLAGSNQALMLMMDVDFFKGYNDTYGHRAGDEFLILVAQTLISSLRKEDFACRMGGDEFAAILFFKDAASQPVMKRRAQQICDKINLALHSVSGGTGLSMGGAFYTEETENFDRLYEAADRALYRAKEAGRGQLSF